MKNKPLLLWGLGAGVIALVVFIVGYAFAWPVDDDDDGCRMSRDGKCAMMKDGGNGGMMGEGGMMSGGMGGMMGNMMSGGMMGSPVDATTAPISIDQAADAGRRYVTDQGNSDLKVTRILEFTNGYYARVGEQSTGIGAYELKIERNSGDVSRTMGPGMMWNKKYEAGMMDMGGMGGMMGMMQMMGGMEGMMGEGGMMGCMKDDNGDNNGADDNGMEGMDHGSMSGNGGNMEGMDNDNMSGDNMSGGNMSGGNMSGTGNMDDTSGMMGMMGSGSVNDKATTADMTIKSADAGSRAQKYADTQFPSSKVSNPDMFYGYYTVDIVKDGRVLALLSVNGYSGQVWVQAWPGSYLGGKAL